MTARTIVVEDTARLCFKHFIFFLRLILGITTTTTTISSIITCTENSNEDLAEHGTALVTWDCSKWKFSRELVAEAERGSQRKEIQVNAICHPFSETPKHHLILPFFCSELF